MSWEPGAFADNKAQITRGFEQLGYDRVRRATEWPYEKRDHSSFDKCFLCRSYGKGLNNIVYKTDGKEDLYKVLAKTLGIDRDSVEAISFNFHSVERFLDLAREWLELNTNKRDQHDPRRDQTVEAAGEDCEGDRRAEQSADIARNRCVEAGV